MKQLGTMRYLGIIAPGEKTVWVSVHDYTISGFVYRYLICISPVLIILGSKLLCVGGKKPTIGDTLCCDRA